jgi:hypothetical protein
LVTTFTEGSGFVVMASPRLPLAQTRAIKEHLLNFANRSEEGKAFFAGTGFTGIRDAAAGLMESMDPYVDATRKGLLPPG